MLVDYPDPKSSQQHDKSKRTTYAGDVQDGIWPRDRVDVVWSGPPPHHFNGNVNTSRHFTGKDDVIHCKDKTRELKENKVQVVNIGDVGSWGMPAIRAA